MEKYKIYIEEQDLHYKLMNFIKPDTPYGLNEQVKNIAKAGNKDFECGAMWGAAMFLLFVNSECEKIYLENPTSGEQKETQEEQKENVVLAQRYIGLKELILSIIETEKRKSFDKILKANSHNDEADSEEQMAIVYHQAICELGNQIREIFEENK